MAITETVIEDLLHGHDAKPRHFSTEEEVASHVADARDGGYDVDFPGIADSGLVGVRSAHVEYGAALH